MSTPPAYPPTPPGGPPTPPGSGGVGLIGKHRNPFLVWLVWPLITLGIYHLVWWYKINREVRDIDQRIEVSPGVAVLALFPGAIILVPPYVSAWKTGDADPAGTSRCGIITGSMQPVDRTDPCLHSRTALPLLPDVAEQPLGLLRHATRRQPGSAACLGRRNGLVGLKNLSAVNVGDRGHAAWRYSLLRPPSTSVRRTAVLPPRSETPTAAAISGH